MIMLLHQRCNKIWFRIMLSPITGCGYRRNGLANKCLLHRCCNAPPKAPKQPYFLGERDVASLDVTDHRNASGPSLKAERDVASLCLWENGLAARVCYINNATNYGFEVRDVASRWHAEGRG